VQIQNAISFVARKLLTTKNGTYFVLVLLISRTLELLEGRNEIEIGQCDSVSAGKGKNCTSEVWSVVICGEMVEEVPAVVADNKLGNEKERKRGRKREGLMVRNYRNSKRVVTKTKREKREVDIRQEAGEALFLRQHNHTPH
jgi:hypothetical protein